MINGRNKKGVSSIAEYLVTFFLVIGAFIAMSIYIQRNFQARMRDARSYMINSVSEQCVSNPNCMQATGLQGNSSIGLQYEPYYAQATSDTISNKTSHKGLEGAGVGSEGIFIAHAEAKSNVTSYSNQLAPFMAENDKVLGNK